jgi:hypothetical protein
MISSLFRGSHHLGPRYLADSVRKAWKLLVHLLVIAVRLSWWWTWRVEGLLIIVVVVTLMSIVRKLVLIYLW